MEHAFISRRRQLIVGALALGACLFAHVPASADATPKAEVLVLHHTNACDKKAPDAGDAPTLGYNCVKKLDTKMVPLALNQPSTAALPNGRTFQLVYSGMAGNRYKVTASISPADGSAGFTKLADITADANKPFNVGGFSYQGGVLVLAVRIVP